MGTRRNRKNRKRKTKRKLIKGDPITFLKNLKTPEQIRKHSLFKKRTVKRNMRGGGQPSKQTRKENIKKLIDTINKQYKNKTEWNLKNIEEKYEENKKEYNDTFLKTNFINKLEQKTNSGESISDKLSICSKWNNDRTKRKISGPYLDGEDIKQGNLSAKEALACAYWSYHTVKDVKSGKKARRLSTNLSRQTDTADGVYFPPSFLEAAGYQYDDFNITKKNKTLEAFEKKSEEEKKSASELAAKAKLEAKKKATEDEDCEDRIINGQPRGNYCIGDIIKGKLINNFISQAWKSSNYAESSEVRYGIILEHLNFPEKEESWDNFKKKLWGSKTTARFKNTNSNIKKYKKIKTTNDNFYTVLYYHDDKINENKDGFRIGIFGEGEKVNLKTEQWTTVGKQTKRVPGEFIYVWNDFIEEKLIIPITQSKKALKIKSYNKTPSNGTKANNYELEYNKYFKDKKKKDLLRTFIRQKIKDNTITEHFALKLKEYFNPIIGLQKNGLTLILEEEEGYGKLEGKLNLHKDKQNRNYVIDTDTFMLIKK